MVGRERAVLVYQESADESLDVYSALRKASEDSTTADQPMWGLTVWQVVGFFLLGLIVVCAVSCYCCEKHGVRIPKARNTREHCKELNGASDTETETAV